MSWSLVVLGSGTALPDADRGPAGLAVRHGDTTVLIDGGGGTQQRLARAGLDPFALTWAVYTHRHPDHTGELIPLAFARHAARLDTPLSVIAAEGFQTQVDALASAYGTWVTRQLEVHEVPRKPAARRALSPQLDLLHAPAAHAHGALHVGFEAHGQRVVFSGDTGPSQALVDLATGADLLVCECGSPLPGDRPSHLAPEEIAELVAQARPGAVWLTHLYPDTDPDHAVATVAATGVPTRRANDGDVWTSA